MLGDKNSKRRRVLRTVLTVSVAIVSLLLLCSAWGGYVRPTGNVYRNLMSLFTLALPFILTIYAITLIVCVAFRRWPHVAALVIALAASWHTVRYYAPINFTAKTATEKQAYTKFKVLTFNVCEFGPYDQSNHTPSPTMRFILDTDADVVLLQEGSQERDYRLLSQTKMMMEEFEQKYPYHSDGNRDLLIFSKHPYDVVVDSTLKHGGDTRFHYYGKAFDVSFPGGRKLRLVNLHLHSMGLAESDKELYLRLTKNEVGSREELAGLQHSLMWKLKGAFVMHAHEAQAVRRLLDNSPSDVVLCGDFNDTPGSWAYRTILGDDMTDAYAECALGPTYTFNDRRLFFKIDHTFYRGSLKALSCSREKAGDSDHYPLLTTFVWTNEKDNN